MVVGIVSSIIATIIVSGVWFLVLILRKKWKKRPLRTLLNFGDSELIFVFPPIQTTHEKILPIFPHGSIEDFLAITNFIKVLLEIGWTGNWRVRSADRLTGEDKKQNLVTVCSPKRNTFTEEVLNEIGSQELDIFRFEQIKGSDYWQIVDNAAHYPSPSYQQIEDYLKEGIQPEDIADQKINDVAVIAKVTNPYNNANKIFIVAGVRGIGTWGAAEFLRKEWKKLYKRKRGLPSLLNFLGFKKGGDFAAVLKVRYSNWNFINCIDAFKDFSQ